MAFQTAMWREADFVCIRLTEPMRQKGDEDFVRALMDIREGRATSEHVKKLLNDCATKLENIHTTSSPVIQPTVLYATNRSVDQENLDKLNALPDLLRVFKATDDVEVDKEIAEEQGWNHRESRAWKHAEQELRDNTFFTKDCTARVEVEMKVGAQVMLLRNLQEENVPPKERLVNGSRGVVIAFQLSDVLLGGWGEEVEWPVVEFVTLERCPQSGKPLRRIKRIEPETFSREVYRKGKCFRSQVPLKLAWALTIHKAQGVTLPLVKVDLDGQLNPGQAYVALSRASSRHGLQIVNFSPSCVKVDVLVSKFYESIDSLHTYKVFLDKCAGMWWHPIFSKPQWVDFFQNVQGNSCASDQFRLWCHKYPPLALQGGGSGSGGGGGVGGGRGDRGRDVVMTTASPRSAVQQSAGATAIDRHGEGGGGGESVQGESLLDIWRQRDGAAGLRGRGAQRGLDSCFQDAGRETSTSDLQDAGRETSPRPGAQTLHLDNSACRRAGCDENNEQEEEKDERAGCDKNNIEVEEEDEAFLEQIAALEHAALSSPKAARNKHGVVSSNGGDMPGVQDQEEEDEGFLKQIADLEYAALSTPKAIRNAHGAVAGDDADVSGYRNNGGVASGGVTSGGGRSPKRAHGQEVGDDSIMPHHSPPKIPRQERA